MTDINILVAFTAGIFSFLSPCVLPIIPSYLSFISGVSLQKMRAAQVASHIRKRVLLNSLAFILGFSLVFISLGASASFLASFFLGYRNVIRVLGGIFILAVGIYLLGVVKFSVLDRYLQFHLKQTRRLPGIGGRRDDFRRGMDSLCGADLGGDSYLGCDIE